jgi:BlaI family transcriptional regulator, penicillinase repressor
MENKELTKAEEQLMHYLWILERGFLKDIVDCFPDPKPAYTTISTVIRVLVKKGFVAYNSYGKINQYYPMISKSDYFQNHVTSIINNFFNGSAPKFASFFANEKMNISELEEIKQIVEEKIKQIKKRKK